MSDTLVTSRRAYAAWLEGDTDRSVKYLPVFSSIQGPSAPAPLAGRQRRLLVFGAPANRMRVYARSHAELRDAAVALGTDEVLDVGPPPGAAPPAGVKSVGILPAAKLSRLLADSLAAFIDYFPAYLSKSTVFAAYCAHGILPVCPRDAASEADGLVGGQHDLLSRARAVGAHRLQEIADSARRWYATHDLRVDGQVFGAALRAGRGTGS